MAQKDSIQLAPVVVQGFVPERFMSGLKIQRIDSVTLKSFAFQNIGDLLSLYTPIAFKNYGPGQLSTVSFRGTSANHTAVLWNGLNINSPTLGQTDFSTIPVAGFDQLSVQYGSAASVVGTDAVGGSILLGSAGRQQPGINISLGRQQESFDNNQSQLMLRYGTVGSGVSSFSGKTGAYFSRMNNRYAQSERRGYRLAATESEQKGFIQDLYFIPGRNQKLSAHVWLTDNDLVVAPGSVQGRERTRTASYRNMIRYEIMEWTARASWVRDVLDYGKGDYSNVDHAVTDRFTLRAERTFDYNLGKAGNLSLLAGGEWSLYRTRVAGYEKPVIDENREDLFLLTRFQPASRWLISLNLRQAFITRYSPPLTPSFGTEYHLVKNAKHLLKARASVARSYRVPTLNERYWKTLGNPDIKPENGFNKEAGIEEQYNVSNRHVITAGITAYHNRVKDWTYWNPAKNYRVENLQEVLSRGIEGQAGWQYQANCWKAGLNGGYTYTRSSQEKVYDAYSRDVIGKQLVYVPVHTGNLNGFVGYKKSRLSAQLTAVSRRFNTFDNSTSLDGYPMISLIGETTVQWGKLNGRIQGRINNVTNAFYLNVMNNAMPGRSFAINLLLSYNRS